MVRDDTIVIRLAKNLTLAEEQDHIESLLRRITQQILEEQRLTIQIHPFRELLSGASQQTVTLGNGRKYTFKLVVGDKLGARRTKHGWTVTVGPQTRRQALHRKLWNLLADAERPRIEKLVEQINEDTLNVRVSRVKFRFTVSQWGSCSPKGVIALNAALLFVKPTILKYVIVHELAHRCRADHSPYYWGVVEAAMPRYQKAREALKEYRLPSL